MDSLFAISDRIYRLLINVYPRAFLADFGEEMAQTMRDQVRDAATDLGGFGVVVLWLKVLPDTIRSAFAEHMRQGWWFKPTRGGFNLGLAIAVGFPMALLSSSSRIWSPVQSLARTVGWDPSHQWLLHRSMALGGIALAGIGLHGLSKRVDFESPIRRRVTIGAVWLGVALGLLVLHIGSFLPIRSVSLLNGLNAIPFALLTFGLVSISVSSFREKGFGVLSFIPLALVASLGWWLFVIMTPPLLFVAEVLEATAVLIHIAFWVILAAVVWADPQEGTHSAPTG